MNILNKEYKGKVYVDDIEEWQDIIEVVDITTMGDCMYRMTVIVKSGTQINRIVRNVYSEQDIKNDRCIYLY